MDSREEFEPPVAPPVEGIFDWLTDDFWVTHFQTAQEPEAEFEQKVKEAAEQMVFEPPLEEKPGNPEMMDVSPGNWSDWAEAEADPDVTVG